MSEFYKLFHSSIPEIFQALVFQDLTATELEKEIGLDNSGLQKTLKILQTKGYVQRYETENPTMNFKSFKWKLTDKGKNAAAPMIALYNRLEELSCH